MKYLSILFLAVFLVEGALGQHRKPDTADVFRLIDTARAQQRRGLPDAAEDHFRQAGELAGQLGFDRGLLMYAGH